MAFFVKNFCVIRRSVGHCLPAVIISKIIIHAALKAMAANTIAISAVVVGTVIALLVDTLFTLFVNPIFAVISVVIIITISAVSRRG